MTTIIELTRVFNFGGTALPDPDSSLSPEAVLDHYAGQYPMLKRGKVELVSDTGDQMVYELKKSKFHPNG